MFNVYLVMQNDMILKGFVSIKKAESFRRSQKNKFLDSKTGNFSRKDLEHSIGNYFHIQTVGVQE